MMSIFPKETTAVSTSLSQAPSFVRSPENTAVSPWISFAASSATSPSRSLTRTCAPCCASSPAVARPIPRAEPVTIAAFPSSTPPMAPPPVLPRSIRLPDSSLLGKACVQRPHGRHETVAEALDLVRRHFGEHLALELVDGLVAGPQHPAALRRQCGREDPPVVRMRSPGDQALPLERVDYVAHR